MDNIIDILIIGRGPAGMSASINAVMRQKSVKIIYNYDSYLKKAEKINNYLGLYDVSGSELYSKFDMHVKKLGIETLNGKVINIIKNDNEFMVNFNGNILKAKSIILALGISKKQEIPNEKKYIGKGISYCATCDGLLYKNKKIIVSGDSKDIVEETNFLSSIASKVTLVTNNKELNNLSKNIEYKSGIIREVIGDTIVKGAVIDNEIINADGIFILRNNIAPNLLIDSLDTIDGYIKTDKDMKTNIDGVYACGDCIGGPFQIAKAVGEGLIAAISASNYLERKRISNER